MRQSAFLVFNPIMVDNYAAFFKSTSVARSSDSVMALHKAIHFSWFGPELLVCFVGPLGFNWCFPLAPDFSKLFPRDPDHLAAN